LTISRHDSDGWTVDFPAATFEAWLTAELSEAARGFVRKWLFNFEDGLPDGSELVYPDSRSRYFATDYFRASCWTPDGPVEALFYVFAEERMIRITHLERRPHPDK
jgi:hypothetical protein